MHKQLTALAVIALALGCNEAKPPAQPVGGTPTSLGALTFERGYPTAETRQKVFDEIDYQRAVQAYLWAYPAVSFQAIQVAAGKDFGMGFNDLGIADSFVDTKSVWLTANNTTIYAFSNIDVGKDGPIVVEVPPGQIVGLIDDFWQRAITDVGLPGPDGAKGGKFLILPPGYSGNVPATGYHVIKATMNDNNVMVRGILRSADDREQAVETVRKMRIYPLSQRNPQPNKFVSISGKVINTDPPKGMDYWVRLSEVINNNPVEERDRFFMAMLKPLGIEKGKPFQPDERQRAILEKAAQVGDQMGRVMLFDGHERFTGATAFEGTKWNWVVLGTPTQEAANYSQLDERLHYTYGAIYTSPFIGVMKAGPGSNYVQTFKDKDGNRPDGAKSYRLHVPANVPAASFWSVTLYDTESRSMLQNSRNLSALSSYSKLKVNADSSIDLYFGPTAPAGLENNWIETVPGKGFYPMFRFYGPKPGLFDGTWKLSDVEVVQ